MKIHHSPLHILFLPETAHDQMEMEYLCLVQHKVFQQTTWGKGVLYALPAEKDNAIHTVYRLLRRRETIQYYLERLGLAEKRPMVLHVTVPSN